ncbi:NACHT domain-containing protein [Nonomuraea sp. NPDC049480]|uniref:NACHT domain-containing protein n=1 Tax=Nonomuraea sp. NPDC049480 TaxID=3364353 RepID=UPI0037AFEF39
MRPLLSYRDAVSLLGGGSALTDVLDKASSMALFGLGGIDLFDARAEAVRLGDGLIRRLRDQVKGLSRYDRTQRLAAAHAVIVVSAFLEVLGEAEVLPELTREDQERLTGVDADYLGNLIGVDLPMPAPQRPHEHVIHAVRRRYVAFAEPLISHLSGLACWDRMNETERDALFRDLPERAVRRYQELFLRLMADFPEVACWSNVVDHQATRAEVRGLARSLTGLQEQLSGIVSARGPSDRLSALIQANRAALSRPITASADKPSGLTIPLLDQGYIDPGFRLFPPEHGRTVISEESWAELARRDDLAAFLSGHLTLPQATDAPLVVLGHPGAGKSVLTRVLAARLPAGQFLPLRVELRGVPADADVLGQIEHGIKDALDEAMSWPELVHAAQGALPVVMLDGFDELLQATGVNQTDYLERVARFQRRQAERGRALAVIVTSRTAVADRGRIPDESIVLRLEPFDEDQVRQWTAIWNHHNHGYFLQHGLQPLLVEHLLAVPDLAGQPLLLLMLALYDTDANALASVREQLHEAELYERLLHGFATREVLKTAEDLSDTELSRAVEDELLRLSITAFAMFNRGLQWVREHDLDVDLRALLPQPDRTSQQHGLRRVLTRAELVIGGFFFVHTTKALREERLKAYEYLHATFGEYLVARLVVRELADMAEELAFAASRNRPTKPDEAFLHALLSFAALPGRSPIVKFLDFGIMKAVPAERRVLLRRHLCELFSTSLMPRPGSVYDAYQPAAMEITARCAAYSANLLLLAVLSDHQPIRGTELFAIDQPEQANELWRRISRLWHSQLSRAEWSALTRTLRVRHFPQDGTRMMVVELDHGDVFRLSDLAFFTWPGSPAAAYPYAMAAEGDGSLSRWMREIAFRDDTSLGHLLLDLVPYAVNIDDTLDAYPESPVADLLAVMLDPTPTSEAYERALGNAPNVRYFDRLLRQLELDCHELPANDVLRFLMAAGPWSAVHRLERVLGNVADRPGVDERLLGEVVALLRRRP